MKLIILLITVINLFSTNILATNQKTKYTIRWVQIHLPSAVADRAAIEFGVL